MFAHLDNGAGAPRIGDAVTLDVQPLAADKAGRPMTVPIYARAWRGASAMKLRRAGIMGVGPTPFDKYEGEAIETLTQRAIVAALADAGVALKNLQAGYAAHLYQGEVFGQRVLRGLRAPPLQIVNVENACAGGSTALREAWLSVATEQNDVVLVVGAEKMDRGLINFVSADLELTLGNTAPAQYALSGQRHMHEFGTRAGGFRRGRGQEPAAWRTQSERALPRDGDA